jgi:hypothetical protein
MLLPTKFHHKAVAHTRQKVVTFEACNFVQGANYQITSISSSNSSGGAEEEES